MTRIDLYDAVQEHHHRDTPPTWMNYFNRTQPQHQHPQWGGPFQFWQRPWGDCEAWWLVNRARMPSGWRWHTDSITYTHNAQGFRNDADFDRMDWHNAHVVLGSSVVAGDGVPQSETISHHIQLMTGRPCVNLGVPSASSDVVFNNVIKMMCDHGRPHALHVIWPSAVRQLDGMHLIEDETGATWTRQDRGPWDITAHELSHATCHYRRNQHRHTVKLLMRGAGYSELFETCYDITPGHKGHSQVGDRLQIHTPFPDDVTQEIQSGKPYTAWNPSAQVWYLNNFFARDVSINLYPHSDPREWAHPGRFVNNAVAQYLIDSI